MVHPAICKLLDDLDNITSKQHFSFNDFINSFDLINYLEKQNFTYYIDIMEVYEGLKRLTKKIEGGLNEELYKKTQRSEVVLNFLQPEVEQIIDPNANINNELKYLLTIRECKKIIFKKLYENLENKKFYKFRDIVYIMGWCNEQECLIEIKEKNISCYSILLNDEKNLEEIKIMANMVTEIWELLYKKLYDEEVMNNILLMCHSFSLFSIIKIELARVLRDKEEEFFSYLNSYEKVMSLIK